MKIYVGITDNDWYEFLKDQNATEVNFWRPGKSAFRALEENELFLFKLHQPLNYIAGGGFFVKYSLLPTFLAWDAFGEKNGTSTLEDLNKAIKKYRDRNKLSADNPQIGCIILTDVFYFDRQNWIKVPDDFRLGIVQGKTYDTKTETGKRLFQDVQDRLQKINSRNVSSYKPEEGYTETMTKHRLGQGAFRVVITDAYQRKCAITGEKTLPVLEAAHIRPYAQNGPHSVNNGLLLRSDFHTLYDDGYITIDKDHRICVSRRLNDDFGNGREYYGYHGRKLWLPDNPAERPSAEFLEWHNENVFLG